jgi:hypothetical protein
MINSGLLLEFGYGILEFYQLKERLKIMTEEKINDSLDKIYNEIEKLVE